MSAFSPLPAKAVLLKVMVETRRRSHLDSTPPLAWRSGNYERGCGAGNIMSQSE